MTKFLRGGLVVKPPAVLFALAALLLVSPDLSALMALQWRRHWTGSFCRGAADPLKQNSLPIRSGPLHGGRRRRPLTSAAGSARRVYAPKWPYRGALGATYALTRLSAGAAMVRPLGRWFRR